MIFELDYCWIIYASNLRWWVPLGDARHPLQIETDTNISLCVLCKEYGTHSTHTHIAYTYAFCTQDIRQIIITLAKIQLMFRKDMEHTETTTKNKYEARSTPKWCQFSFLNAREMSDVGQIIIIIILVVFVNRTKHFGSTMRSTNTCSASMYLFSCTNLSRMIRPKKWQNKLWIILSDISMDVRNFLLITIFS